MAIAIGRSTDDLIPEGTYEMTGTIVSISYRSWKGEWGAWSRDPHIGMHISLGAPFDGFCVWGTVPRSVERQLIRLLYEHRDKCLNYAQLADEVPLRVGFTATVERSDKPGFADGFFSHPSNASLISTEPEWDRFVAEGRKLAERMKYLEDDRAEILSELEALPPEDRERPEVQEAIADLMELDVPQEIAMPNVFEGAPDWLIGELQRAEVLIRVGLRNALIESMQTYGGCTCGECDDERSRAAVAVLIQQADRAVRELEALRHARPHSLLARRKHGPRGASAPPVPSPIAARPGAGMIQRRLLSPEIGHCRFCCSYVKKLR